MIFIRDREIISIFKQHGSVTMGTTRSTKVGIIGSANNPEVLYFDKVSNEDYLDQPKTMK